MKFVNRAIDRFCYKHPRFGITNLMMYIVIGNAIVYLFSIMDTSGALTYLLNFDASLIFQGQLWRLVTFLFVSGYTGIGDLLFFFLFMYFYYFIGSTLEREWGSGRFTIYYISGIVLSAIYAVIVFLITKKSLSITASFINLSMFFAFATLFPETRVLVFYIIPVKIKWLALLNAVYFLYSIIVNPFPYNILPVVGILNYIIFCGDSLIGQIRPSRHFRSKSAINFKKEAKKYKKDMEKTPYTRKCSVCGKTDKDYPDLEFRFCSRCEGYHCFCIDHIDNHIHFDK